MRQVNGRLQEALVSLAERLRSSEIGSAFADEVLNSVPTDDAQFTLAVCGQMRSGKSTLINSIIGRNLSKTDVSETTATVNWIRYGDSTQTEHFRVTWDGNPAKSELIPIAERDLWCGDSINAKKTRYLEYFCDAALLKSVQIVDTPGSRSVLDAHQETLQNFLAAARRCEDQSNYYGGSADCIAYVFPVSPRESDDRILADFSRNTRIPGSSPFNSIGILPKWEATIDGDRPWEAATRQAEKTRKRFRNFVSDVIVVSGPLHSLTEFATARFWESVVEFSAEMDEAAIRLLLLTPEKYRTGKIVSHKWNPDARQELLAEALMYGEQVIPWGCFKVLLKYARQRQPQTGEELRRQIAELAGINRLIRILEDRFFTRATMIREATALRKALLPCDRAIRELKTQLEEAEDMQQDCVQALSELANRELEFPATTTVLKAICQKVARQPQKIVANIRDLELVTQEIREPYQRFDDDLAAIQLLDENSAKFDESEITEILAILGAFGSTDEERFKVIPEWSGSTFAIDNRLSWWLEKYEQSAGVRRQVIEQVVLRLEAGVANSIRQELS